MNKDTSIFLDIVRFGAALLVFMHHFAYPDISGAGKVISFLGMFGEDAVVVFFVLSGYVIAFVSSEHERGAIDYFSSRFARLYSVAIPALILTLIADWIGRAMEPSLYEAWHQSSLPLIRILASVTFTTQLWSLDIRPFSNVPYWSISYEFWYYVFFGIVLFLRGKSRMFAICCWAFFVGPLIVLMLPTWLIGIYAYRRSQCGPLSNKVAKGVLVVLVALYVGFWLFELRPELTGMTDRWVAQISSDPYVLHKARSFLYYYLVAILVAVGFIACDSLARGEALRLQYIQAPVRWLAKYTFSLYLLHYPLLYLFTALSPWEVETAAHRVFVVLATAIAVLSIAAVTESRKREWKAFFVAGISRLAVRARLFV
jgi:peptidoglycan/LPS O-acetylase OafA/YrhL